jgi:predicted transcriptional regulator
VLTVSALFNWDVVITKYNFAHYDRSLIEYRFIYELSNATLPYAVKSIEELTEIQDVQEKIMPPDIISQNCLWNYQTYSFWIDYKKNNFLKTYKSRNILEWNIPDYLAYKKLSEEK